VRNLKIKNGRKTPKTNKEVPLLAVFCVFLPFLIFKLHTGFARTPPKITFLILWAAANCVHRNSLAKSGISSGISLAHLSTALKNRLDEKR